MAALLGPVRKFLNSLLPFTNPNTPLAKDLLHASVLIVIFYFGPRWMEMWRRRKSWAEQREEQEQGQEEHIEILPDTRPDGTEMLQADDTARDELDDGRDETNLRHNAHEHMNHVEPREAIPPDGAIPIPAEPPHFHEPIAPAQPPRQPTHRDPRTIGTKKAKSLARRDQRRAYNEFMRSQGDEQRARDAADAAEREEAIFEEKRRRAAIEMEVEGRLRKERDEEKRRAEEQRTKEWRRRENVVQRAREGLEGQGYVDLRRLGEREDVEGLVRASGMLGTRKRERDGVKEITLVTSEGWLVRVDEDIMKELYSRALKLESGRVDFEEMGDMLGGILRERAAITSTNR